MQKKNTARAFLLLIATAGGTNAVAKSKKGFWSDVGVAVASVAGAVAVGVGAVKIVDWYFSETNQQLIARSQSAYNDVVRQFSDVMVEFEREYNVSDPSLAHATGAYKDIFEPILYNLSTMLFRKGVNQAKYINDVVSAKNKLKTVSLDMHRRIDKLQLELSHLNSDELKELYQIRTIVNQIDGFMPRIVLFADYCDYHKPYFVTYYQESLLLGYYKREISIINGQSFNYLYDLRDAIFARNAHSKYPFTLFVDKLRSDLHDLKTSMYNLRSAYSIRLNEAKQLLSALDAIRSVTMADEQYKTELFNAERERLEKMRVRALEEQNRIERARLNALHEQNGILHETNRLNRQALYHGNHTMNDSSDVHLDVHISL